MMVISDAFVSHDELACGSCGLMCLADTFSSTFCRKCPSELAACWCEVMLPPRSKAPKQLCLSHALKEFATCGLSLCKNERGQVKLL